MTEIPYTIFGLMFWITGLITLIIFFYTWPLLSKYLANPLFMFFGVLIAWFVIHLAIAFLAMAGIYFYFDYKIYNRTKKIEEVLPDFLNVFSENLRSGMTTDKSLWRAVKPEFGVLASEIRIAAKQVMTGKDIAIALEDFSKKYDSSILNRSLKLIVEGMKSGTEIALIIDKVVEDIHKTNDLKKRLATNAFSFLMFITIIVIFIAPGLFALSQNLLIVIESFVGNLQAADLSAVSLPIKFDTIAVTPEDFFNFARASLIIISFFASLIVSIISKGEMKAGVKYVPIFILGSVLSHLFFVKILTTMFGGLFG